MGEEFSVDFLSNLSYTGLCFNTSSLLLLILIFFLRFWIVIWRLRRRQNLPLQNYGRISASHISDQILSWDDTWRFHWIYPVLLSRHQPHRILLTVLGYGSNNGLLDISKGNRIILCGHFLSWGRPLLLFEFEKVFVVHGAGVGQGMLIFYWGWSAISRRNLQLHRHRHTHMRLHHRIHPLLPILSPIDRLLRLIIMFLVRRHYD